MSEGRQDPWADVPWSDGEPAHPVEASPSVEPDLVTVGQPDPGLSSGEGAARASAAGEPLACPWCGTPVAEGATRCSSCGAALAQRESIGDLVVPGLTAVDPALKDLDGRPLHLRGPSPSHGAASGIIAAAAAGGPIGLAIIGGVGAVAAVEYMGVGGENGNGHEHVGETSEAVLQAIERLERGEKLPTADDATPRPEVDAAPPSSAQSPQFGETEDEETRDGGS